MVIKSSETKSDQPFLELYKKLSKEVVAGGGEAPERDSG